MKPNSSVRYILPHPDCPKSPRETENSDTYTRPEADFYLTFQTVSLSVNLPYIRITSKVASVKLFNILTNKDGGAHYENNFQDKRMEEMLRRWYHWNFI